MVVNLSKAEIILREIEKRVFDQFLPIVGREKGRRLVEKIVGVKPKRVLEVGTLIGYSAILMGRKLDKGASFSLHI